MVLVIWVGYGAFANPSQPVGAFIVWGGLGLLVIAPIGYALAVVHRGGRQWTIVYLLLVVFYGVGLAYPEIFVVGATIAIWKATAKRRRADPRSADCGSQQDAQF